MKKIMKVMVFLIIFGVAAPLTFSKYQITKIVNQIKKDYNKTNKNEKKYKVQTLKINSSHEALYNSEGNNIEYYTENGELRKIRVTREVDMLEGKINKYVTEYYVKDGKLYFLLDTLVEENGIKMETLPSQKFYFSPDEKLIREIDDEDRTTDYEEGEQKMSPEDITGEEVLLNKFNELKSLAGF